MKKDILAVFDLDFTLWDCGGMWIDCTTPPFYKLNGKITDSENRNFRLYSDVPDILNFLMNKNIDMGIASRTGEPAWAEHLLYLFGIEKYFRFKEIYPAGKSTHFKKLHKLSGIPYSDMFFFDDEYRNIDEVSKLGVNCMHVRNGVSKKTVLDFIQYG